MTEDDRTCSVFRSDVDDRVWMCNVPMVDLATGMQASASLSKLKRYVEGVVRRDFHGTNGGDWILREKGLWLYNPHDAE